MIGGITHGLFHLFYDVVGGGKVRVSHTEVDNVHAFCLDFPFLSVNFGKEVGRKLGDSVGPFVKYVHVSSPFLV